MSEYTEQQLDDIDVAVAVHVFGHEQSLEVTRAPGLGPSGCWSLPPKYTRSGSAMLDVVEKMRADGRKITIETGYFGGKCVNDVVVSSNAPTFKNSGQAITESMPLAVALAALQAVGHPYSEQGNG